MSSTASWDALAGVIAGEVVLPGSPRYEAVRKPPIARFHDVRPEAIVRCANPSDVAETLAFATRSGLAIAVRSGGHCFAGRSSTRGLLVDVAPIGSVSVVDGVARVGAGARLGDLYDALDEHGLTIPGGCGPFVGIAGLALGGGFGLLGRKHGLTCDSLRAAEVVLPDGRVVNSDADQHDDLLWALRGAGAAGFGIVTTLSIDTVAAPAATSFHLRWPRAHAAAVVDAWQAWAPDAPREMAASLLFTASADIEQPPVVIVSGAMIGAASDAAEQLEELVARAGADPATSESRHASYREIKHHLVALDDELDDGHAVSRSEFVARPVPSTAVAALVDHLADARTPGQARALEFTPWGGAYNDPPADATAFPHRDARFLLKHEVVVDAEATAATRDAARSWLERSFGHARPWGSGGVYPNFADAELADPGRAYYAANLRRLRRVKATYDPDERFNPPQAVSPAR